MVLVAVAGGSSPTLGRSIVTAIQETGEHKAVILSRLVDEKEVKILRPSNTHLYAAV